MKLIVIYLHRIETESDAARTSLKLCKKYRNAMIAFDNTVNRGDLLLELGEPHITEPAEGPKYHDADIWEIAPVGRSNDMAEQAVPEVTIMRVAGDRPPGIPVTYWIFNAPRPLFGTIQWEGEFKHGNHYAAIDPEDKYVKDMLECAIENDAWLCQYVRTDEIKQALKDGVKALGLPEPDWSRYADRCLHTMYLDQHPPAKAPLPQPGAK